MVRESLSEKMTFEPRFKRSEGLSHEAIWRDSLPPNVNHACKGPEVETCQFYRRVSKEASMAGTGGAMGRTGEKNSKMQ